MPYKRVTEGERTLIYRWSQEGKSERVVAELLNRNPSTICREIARNSGQRGYRPKQAHERAQEKAKRAGSRRFTATVRADAEMKLKEGWTPEIIGGRARLEGRAWVCKETIYKHIYADAKSGGDLWTYLPRAHRKRRRRCPRQDGRGRGRIPNQRMIDTRPAEVETRKTGGHWEGDLINGAHKTGNLVTLVERNTRFSLIGRTDGKEAEEVTQEISALYQRMPQSVLKGVTFDNGKEFSLHEALSRITGMDVYFARPYHSWERGTNENTNGLIRRLYPKMSSFAEIGDVELRRIDRFVNDRPRKCLDWMTPREKMAAYLGFSP
jgi:transposase, IS30 family